MIKRVFIWILFVFGVGFVQLKAQSQSDTSALMDMIGGQAPDFELPNLDWEDIKLSEQEANKVILIDFWASWCRYCRQFNGELVELYDIYNKEGFEIISISLDYDYYKWKRAVKEDGLTWINVNDRSGLESKLAEKYNIIHTPTTFLLDSDMVIQAIDLEGDELEEKIKKLLK